MKIEICPFCDSKIIKRNKSGKIITCLDCDKSFTHNKLKNRELLNDDYLILDSNSKKEDKEKIYNFLFSLKGRLKYLTNTFLSIEESFKKWLDINYIKFEIGKDITIKNVFDFLAETKYEDCHCSFCGKETEFTTQLSRHEKGYYKYCNSKCFSDDWSNRQKGTNNTSYRMSEETKLNSNKKISNTLKEKIKNGEYTPKITNSWCKSMIRIEINNETKMFRSSWELYFYLKNQHLSYEELRVPYIGTDKKDIFTIITLNSKGELRRIKPKQPYKEKISSDLKLNKKTPINLLANGS